MNSAVDRGELRERLGAFDEHQKKIVGGLMAVMFKNAEQVRDPEWMCEQFVQIALLAGGFEDVENVRSYAREHITPVMDACYMLFQAVGEDLAPRVDEGFTHADAMLAALSYFGAASVNDPSTGD